LLVERKDKSAVERLQRLSVEATNAKVRLQTLCTLDEVGALTFQDVKAAARDRHPAVREHAVRVAALFARDFAAPSRDIGGQAELYSLANDPDARVRYQMAFTLGAPVWEENMAGVLLAGLALKDFETPGMQTAIMSSAPRHVELLLHFALVGEGVGRVSPALVEQLIGLAVALNKQKAVASALESIAYAPLGQTVSWKFNALASLLDGLERRNKTLRQFAAECGPEVQGAVEELEKLFLSARVLAASNNAEEEERLASIRLLARGPKGHDEDLKRLGHLLGAQNSSAIQKAALASLARQKDRAAADVLLGGWKEQGPALRLEVLNVLLGRVDWCRALLAAVQKGEIPAGQIGAAFQQKLLNHSDGTVKQRAGKLFTATSKDRGTLLKQYASVAKLTGDATKGMALFRQQCATCHKLRGEGSEVGPDLGALAGKDVHTLLVAILDPNQSVEVRYTSYSAVVKDGREVSGIIAAETAGSITLRAPGGREETLLRTELGSFTGSGLSLMPEGLEKGLAPQDMADLLAALAGR
jgi:putative heme-binding domain-containing protein